MLFVPIIALQDVLQMFAIPHKVSVTLAQFFFTKI